MKMLIVYYVEFLIFCCSDNIQIKSGRVRVIAGHAVSKCVRCTLVL
jgi:hypothetical protein